MFFPDAKLAILQNLTCVAPGSLSMLFSRRQMSVPVANTGASSSMSPGMRMSETSGRASLVSLASLVLVVVLAFFGAGAALAWSTSLDPSFSASDDLRFPVVFLAEVPVVYLFVALALVC